MPPNIHPSQLSTTSDIPDDGTDELTVEEVRRLNLALKRRTKKPIPIGPTSRRKRKGKKKISDTAVSAPAKASLKKLSEHETLSPSHLH